MIEPIKLLLVDDHEVVRTGLRSFLQTQSGLEVIGEACNGVEAMAKSAELCPDVILMDITMPEMDGLEATRRMANHCPKSRVLALTVHEDKQYFFEMLAAGAQGYVTTQAAAEELVAAIRAVAEGYVYLQPALARWLLDDYRDLSEKSTSASPQAENEVLPSLKELSAREQEVLKLVADGLTTPQIGEHLGLSPKTISRHRERIMNKLNMHTNADLVKFAIRTGLIQL